MVEQGDGDTLPFNDSLRDNRKHNAGFPPLTPASIRPGMRRIAKAVVRFFQPSGAEKALLAAKHNACKKTKNKKEQLINILQRW